MTPWEPPPWAGEVVPAHGIVRPTGTGLQAKCMGPGASPANCAVCNRELEAFGGHGHVRRRADGQVWRCAGPKRGCTVCVAERDILAAAWNAAVAEQQAERNALYRERAVLVAHLAAVYPAHLCEDPSSPGWAVCTVELPDGQAGWHLASSDLDLFTHVPAAGCPPYDGHSKADALERVQLATAAAAAGGCG